MNSREISQVVNTILTEKKPDTKYFDLDDKTIKLLVSYFLSHISVNIQKEKFVQFCKALGPLKVFHVFKQHYSIKNLNYLIASRQEKTLKKVKNIALCTWKLGLGGIERVISLLSQMYTDLGYNVIILAEEPYKEGDYPYSGAYECLGTNEYFLNLDRIIKEYNIDTIEFHNYEKSLLPLWYLSKFSDVNTIFCRHSSPAAPEFNDGISFFLDYQISRLADLCTVLSRKDQVYLHHHIGNNVAMMPNPLTFDPNQIEQAPLDSKTVIFTGRFAFEKNIPFLIDSFATVVKSVPDARLMLVGAGSKKKYIEQKILKLKLSQNIELVPYMSDISSYLKKSSIHVLTSFYEGFPMALVEAKAYGIPSVLTKMDNLEFQYYGGHVSVAQGNQEGFAQELIKLLNDKEYRLQMGKEAKTSLKYFSNESLKERWQRIFDGFSNNNLYELDLLHPDPNLNLSQILDQYYEDIIYIRRAWGFTAESDEWARFSTLSLTGKFYWLIKYTSQKILPYRLVEILKSLKKLISKS